MAAKLQFRTTKSVAITTSSLNRILFIADRPPEMASALIPLYMHFVAHARVYCMKITPWLRFLTFTNSDKYYENKDNTVEKVA